MILAYICSNGTVYAELGDLMHLVPEQIEPMEIFHRFTAKIHFL